MLERPRIRPHLAATPADRGGQHYVIYDQLRLSDATLRVSALELEWVSLFDGSRTLREIQSEAMQQLGGVIVPLDFFARLVNLLEEAVFLEGPRAKEAA